MQGLEIPSAIAGTLILLVVLWDTFETMILPRSNGPGLRITRFYFTGVWRVWRFLALRLQPDNPLRSAFLGVFGPLSLVFLIVFWANLLILGFGLLNYGVGATQASHLHTQPGNFGDYLYLSGVTLFTLGYGDKAPASTPTKTLCVLESGVGFGLLATVIGYLPTLYQTFARREAMVLRLYVRTGNPASAEALVAKYRDAGVWESLVPWLAEWESWGAELTESHRSYPVLAFYRSQKDGESWLAAALVMCDVYELVEKYCPRDDSARGALLLQAKVTRDMIADALNDLVKRLRPHTDQTPGQVLSDQLLLSLPPRSGTTTD